MPIASEIILIGGSAGSYSLISELLGHTPTHFHQAICIVIHRNRHYETQIETSLAHKYNRNIKSVMDKMRIEQNHIYFAPAGYHLLIEPDRTFSLDCSEPINYSRPSIDVLYETAAEIYKDKCTAILLSGANSDGANGLIAVENAGGKIIIQNPIQAAMRTMPQAGKNVTRQPQILDNEAIISFFKNLN